MSSRVDGRSRPHETARTEGASSAPEGRRSAGSGNRSGSSIESMGGGAAAGQTKSWAQKFFEKAAKLPWCCGSLFKMIAGWFNIVIDDNNGGGGVGTADRKKQTQAKKIIEKVFENENPSAKKIGEAQKAFKTLSLSGKLAVLVDLLGNKKCTAEVALPFIKLLGPALGKLKEHIVEIRGEGSDRSADAILNKNCKGEIVRQAVAACLADVQNKADEAKAKLIRKTFEEKGEYPSAQARKAALEAFRGLESSLTQLMIFYDLTASNNITAQDLAEFAVSLTTGDQAEKTKPADDSDEEEVEAVSSKKKPKRKEKEEESDDEGDKEIHPSNVQGRLLAAIKQERHDAEEEEVASYKAIMKDINQYKKENRGKLPEGVEVPPKPKAYDNLKDYFRVSASDNHLRETLKEQTKALLQQLQEEQGVSKDDEE